MKQVESTSSMTFPNRRASGVLLKHLASTSGWCRRWDWRCWLRPWPQVSLGRLLPAAYTPATSLQARLTCTGRVGSTVRPLHSTAAAAPLPPPPAVGAQENACVPLPQPSGEALKAASDNGITNPALLDTLVKVGRPGGCLRWQQLRTGVARGQLPACGPCQLKSPH